MQLLIITNVETLSRAVDGGLELGANASIAAGSEGLKGSLSTDKLPDIYDFAKLGKGLFAEINLKRATAAPRDLFSAAYFGRPATAQEIVIDRGLSSRQAGPSCIA